MLRISRSRRRVAPKTVGAGSRTAGCRRAIHDGRASLVDTEAMGLVEVPCWPASGSDGEIAARQDDPGPSAVPVTDRPVRRRQPGAVGRVLVGAQIPGPARMGAAGDL